MPTLSVLDATGTPVTINTLLSAGRAAAASSSPTALSNEDKTVLDSLATLITATNVKLDTMVLQTDTLETLIASTNTKLDTVITQTDTLETLIASTNTKLDTLDTRVDGLETQTGIITETAPANDTASSGLNGRGQRVAQNLTALGALVGEVAGSPTANTVLDRLKALLTGIVLAAGTALLGKVGIDQTTPGTTNKVSLGTDTVKVATSTVSPSDSAVVTAASAYAAGNTVGAKRTFASAIGATGGGVIQSARLTSKSVQSATFKLYIFSQDPTNTTWTDKATPAINVADLPYLITVLTFTGSDSGLGTHSLYTIEGVGKAFNCTSGTSLFGILITLGTPTFTATTDITVALNILQDAA